MSALANGRASIVTVTSAVCPFKSTVTLGMRGESRASSLSASRRAAFCTAMSPLTSKRVTSTRRSEASTQRFNLISARADQSPKLGTLSAAYARSSFSEAEG
jgi:hypothetical protein